MADAPKSNGFDLNGILEKVKSTIQTLTQGKDSPVNKVTDVLKNAADIAERKAKDINLSEVTGKVQEVMKKAEDAVKSVAGKADESGSTEPANKTGAKERLTTEKTSSEDA